MTIDIIQSQKTEILFEAVMSHLNAVEASPADIFKKKYFIVPSHGVGQWLKQKIAERQGISANLDFEALRTFQWSLYQTILGKEKVAQAPQMLNMKWKIFLFLSDFISQNLIQDLAVDHPLQPIFSRVQQHCQAFSDVKEREQKQKSMLYWIADQTSRLFANYMIYRGQCVQGCVQQCQCRQNWLSFWGRNAPLNVEKWVRRPEKEILETQPEVLAHAIEQAQQLEEWQRYIWQQQFAEDFEQMQQIDAWFWQAIEGEEGVLFQAKLPQQIFVFSILELPPSQLYFLRRLAQYISVKIFHFSASQEYWADSVDPKWKAKYALKYPMIADAYESRHPLLTRLGKQARDISALLTQLSGGEEGLWQDEFPEELASNLLESLQSDILYLHEPAQGTHVLAEDDHSIQVHICHSSLRQLEVLKDQLLQWLAAPQQLPRQPSDIVVLVPNLSEIEPLIRTVFTSGYEQGKGYLPVKIAGVPLLDAIQLWQAITLRIKLLQQRFTPEQFIDWLSLIAVQQYYQLNFDQIQRMTELLQQAGFKRGFDAVHLAQSLAPQDQDFKFTFRYALDRLALAIAMPEHAIFNGVLSLTDVRSSDFELIAILIQIYEDLDTRRDWLYAEHISLANASHDVLAEQGILSLLAILEQEIQHFQEISGFSQIEEALKKLKRIVQMTEAESAKLSLNYLLDEIANSIEHQVSQTEPTGQITFAQMGQLRPLPYRLVVCLNMDTGKFPNRDAKLPFDLMELLRAELGDRSRFEDDQGAFLDALLLAQESFWLFYNGFDVNDAEVRDPSSIVQELMSHLAFVVEKDSNQPENIEIEGISIATQLQQLFYVHTLQPYDPKSFVQTDILKFKNQWFDVAKKIIRPNAQQFHWLQQTDHVLSLEFETPTVLTASHWIKDLSSPAAHFLKVKGIAEIDLVGEQEEFEPLQLNGLQKYQIRDYLKQYIEDDQSTLSVDLALLQDKLPVGKMVDATWQLAQTEQALTQRRLANYGGKITVTTQRTWQYSADFHFKITVPEQQNCTQWVTLTSSSCYGERPLTVWLEYLLWRASVDSSDNLTRVAIYKNKTMQISNISQQDAKHYLDVWLAVWQLAQQQPFVLPPKLFTEKLGKLSWEVDDQGRTYCPEKYTTEMKTQWQGRKYYSSGFENAYSDQASMKHPLWALVVLEDQALQQFEDYLERYAADLYAPLTTHIQELKEDIA